MGFQVVLFEISSKVKGKEDVILIELLEQSEMILDETSAWMVMGVGTSNLRPPQKASNAKWCRCQTKVPRSKVCSCLFDMHHFELSKT